MSDFRSCYVVTIVIPKIDDFVNAVDRLRGYQQQRRDPVHALAIAHLLKSLIKAGLELESISGQGRE